MGSEDEEVTIDLALREYLSGNAEKAARALEDLADQTKKAARALLLLDKRADKAANSLLKLAAAARTYNAASAQMSTGLADVNSNLKQNVIGADRSTTATKRLEKQAKSTGRQMKLLSKSINVLQKALTSAGMATFMLAKGMALVGGAAVAGVAVQNILAVAGALSTLASFAALAPLALGGLIAVVATAKLAFGGLGDAIKAAVSGDAAALEKAFKKLPPSARAFVKELTPALKLFKGMKETVQGAFLTSLTKDIPTALRNLQPTIRDGMKGIAAQMGQVVNEIASYFTTENGKRMFGRFFQAGTQIVGLFSRNVKPLLEGMGDVIETVKPAWDRFIGAADSGLKKFADWISQISNDGSLESWLVTAFEVAKMLWEALKDVGSIIEGIVSAAGGAEGGAGALGALGMALGEVSKWVNSFEGQSALQTLFSSLGEIVRSLAPILGIVATTIGTVLAPALADIVTGAAPGMITFLQALADALVIIAPHMGPLGEAFGELLAALAPLLPVLGELVSTGLLLLIDAVTRLTPIISLLAEAIGPILLPFLTTMMEIFQQLAPLASIFFTTLAAVLTPLIPILQEVGTMFQQYMAVHLQRIVEMLPTLIPLVIQLAVAFGEWFMAALEQILPLLPQLFPLMLQIMEVGLQLAPVVLQLAIMFLQVATAMMPIGGLILRIIGVLMTMLTAVVTVASGVIGAFGRIHSGVVSAVSSVIGAIQRLIGMASRMASPFVSAIGSIVSAFGRIGGAVAGAIGSIERLIGKAAALTSIDVNPFRFAGGDVVTGQKYTVGEIGPELFVPKVGTPQMIGEGGIESRSFGQSGFIVPSFMVDAFKGVERAMESASVGVGSDGGSQMAAVAEALAKRGPDVVNHYDVSVIIQGDVSKEVDIERAVEKALRNIERDRKERK